MLPRLKKNPKKLILILEINKHVTELKFSVFSSFKTLGGKTLFNLFLCIYLVYELCASIHVYGKVFC